MSKQSHSNPELDNVLGTAKHAPLTDYQLGVLKDDYADHGQARFDSMQAAVQFCKAVKLTDKQASIIEDLREGENRAFFVENKDNLGMIRSFERVYKISAAIARATGEAV